MNNDFLYLVRHAPKIIFRLPVVFPKAISRQMFEKSRELIKIYILTIQEIHKVKQLIYSKALVTWHGTNLISSCYLSIKLNVTINKFIAVPIKYTLRILQNSLKKVTFRQEFDYFYSNRNECSFVISSRKIFRALSWNSIREIAFLKNVCWEKWFREIEFGKTLGDGFSCSWRIPPMGI